MCAFAGATHFGVPRLLTTTAGLFSAPGGGDVQQRGASRGALGTAGVLFGPLPAGRCAFAFDPLGGPGWFGGGRKKLKGSPGWGR